MKDNKIKRKFTSNNKVNKLIIISTFIVIVFVAIGFSAFDNKLSISGLSMVVRVNADIRVTDIQFLDSSTNAYSLDEDYDVSNIKGTVALPDENAYVDYRFEVTNFGNIDEGIANITGSNDNLTYELIGDYNLEDKICDASSVCKLGIEKTIDIRVKWADGKYDSSNTNQSFIFTFDFEIFNSVIVDSSISSLISNCPTEIINKGSLTFNYSGDVDDLIIYVEGVKNTDYTYDSTNKTISMVNVEGTVYIKMKTETNYLGKSVVYLGKTWYVLSTNDSTTTLIADYNEFSDMAHCVSSVSSDYCYWASSSSSVQYKWSKSQIADYLNNTWLSTVDGSDIIASEICDDEYSNGGTHLNDGTSCTNGYVSSKVRLISSAELTEAKDATGTNTAWLYGTSAYNALGAPYSFEVNYVDTTGSFVASRSLDSSGGSYNADHAKPIRPVITIPTTVFKGLITTTITYEGITETNLPTTAELGDDLVILLANGYYNISVYLNGTLLTSGYTYEDNILTIKDVSGDLLIKATGLEVSNPVTYLGKNWYVLATDDTNVTLIADYGEFSNMSHCIGSVSSTYCYWASSSSSAQYTWSKSQIVDYLNNTWLSTVDGSNLVEYEICDDDYSNGGPVLKSDSTTCTNGYVTSKVRFITSDEFTTAKANAGTDTTWLYGTSAYNAMGSSYKFEANFISTSGSFVAARSISTSGSYNADHDTPIRPVITVPASVFDK